MSVPAGVGTGADHDGRIPVLQFLTSFGPGGTERQVVNLARALDPARFQQHFGCFYRWGDLLGEVTERGIPVVEYRVDKLYVPRAWWVRLRFLQDLKRQHIQLVHAYNFYANVFALPAARLAGVPIVASIRGPHDTLSPLHRRAHRLVCRVANRIAVNAETLRRSLIAEGYDAKRIVVIRNGVDLTRFSARHANGRLRAEFGLPPQAPLVAVLARLVPTKGLDVFLEAAALVAGRVPSARFLIIGDQFHLASDGAVVGNIAYRSALQSSAGRLGIGDRVVFTGVRLDVPDLLSEVAVSVLPSVGGEGLSNTLLESMAAGVPVVATTVGGNAEAVEEGVTGLLVPRQDAPALARAICHLLENREVAARFGTAGRERIFRHFSLERYARDTERLYLDVLGTQDETGHTGRPRSRRIVD